MNIGTLERDGELEMVTGNSLVECEAFHAELLTGSSRVTQVHVKHSGASAIFRRGLVVRERLRRLLESREGLDDERGFGENAEQLRDAAPRPVEYRINRWHHFFSGPEAG